MRVRASVGVMTAETITLIWPTADLINLNAERTWHHQRRARMVRAIRSEVAAMAADLRRFAGAYRLTIRYRWHDQHTRDSTSGNWQPSEKAVIDALVECGVLPGDSDKWCKGYERLPAVYGMTKGYAAMTLTVEEVAG